MNATFDLRTWAACTILAAVCQSSVWAGGPGSGHFGGHSGGRGNFSQNTVRSAPALQNMQSFKLNNNVIRSNPSFTPMKPGNNKITTINPVGGTKIGGGLKFPNGGIITLPPTTGTNPTTGGGKFPGGGIKLPPGGLPPVVANPPSGGGKFPGGGIKWPSGGLPPVVVADPPKGGGIKWPPGNVPPIVVDPPKGGGGTTTPPGGGTPTPPGGGTPTPPTTPPGGGGTMPPSGGGKHHHGFPYWLLPALYGNVGYGYGGGYGGSGTYVNNVSSAPVILDSLPAAPVQAPSPAPSKLTLKLGQNYTIANENFGENMGALMLTINGLTLPVQIDKWDAQQVSFTMPAIGLAQAADGMFQILKSDRSVSRSVPVMVMPAQ